MPGPAHAGPLDQPAVEARRQGEVLDRDPLVGAVDERHRLEEVHLALREEAVRDAVGEGGAEPVRVAEAGERGGGDRRSGVLLRDERADRLHQRRVDRRAVADDGLGELDRAVARREGVGESGPDVVLAEARRDAAVDAYCRLRGDHVDLLGGRRHRWGEGDAEQRLEHHRDPRVRRLDALERGGERGRVVRREAQLGGDVIRCEAECRQEGVGLRRTLWRDAAVGERREDRPELGQRVVADPRQRSVARAAVGGQREAEDALLGDADRVDAPAAVLERRARALVDDQVGAHLVGMLGAEPLRSVGRARLLVGGDHELQLASLRPPTRLGERARRRHLRSNLALHVERSAPPDATVAQLARPGVDLPLGRVGQHGVDVAEQAQRRPVGSSGRPQSRYEVRPARDGGQQLDLESGALEQPAQVLLALLLGPRRIDRVEPDQPLQQLRRLPLQLPRVRHRASICVVRRRPARCSRAVTREPLVVASDLEVPER